MGIASMVLGIIAILISIIPTINKINVVLFFIVIGLAIVDLVDKNKTKNFAIAGIILVYIAGISTFLNFADDSFNEMVSTNAQQQEEKIKKVQDTKNKIEEQQKAMEEYKKTCKTYSYKEIARNPDNYKGKRVAFTGKVLQVTEDYFDSDSITILISVTKNEYDYWEDNLYCTYKYSAKESKILEDDVITIYGICKGDTSYTSLLGQKITIPEISIKYIELIEG